jgi:hypothetical protein
MAYSAPNCAHTRKEDCSDKFARQEITYPPYDNKRFCSLMLARRIATISGFNPPNGAYKWSDIFAHSFIGRMRWGYNRGNR